jgi:3-carboxy-cis,cis-muconate cycloisomerase
MTAPTFDRGFTTPEMATVFSAERTVAVILEFEAALAGALADAGVAPMEAAAAIAAACLEPFGQPETLLASAWESGTALIAIKAEIERRLDAESKGWVHRGATSQDAVDTGRMLQAKDGLAQLEGSAVAVARHLRGLVDRHRHQPQMARTFLQDARPTTFGARAAGWLAPTLGHINELRRVRGTLPVQLGGPSGDSSSYGMAATEVIAALARRLGLTAPPVAWHTDRSPIWGLARTVEAMALTATKISTDVALLAQSSVGEVTVRPGGSSSMAEKRNPIDAIRAVAAASACSGFASMLVMAPVNQLDRGVGGWHTEWLALPMLFHTGAAAVASVATLLESLEVDTERMSRVIEESGLEASTPDNRLIDGVLARFDQVVGPG